MRIYQVEVFDEDRVCYIKDSKIEATSLHTAAARAIKAAKIRRGSKKVVVRVYPIGYSSKE
jgi:hypothetical protein